MEGKLMHSKCWRKLLQISWKARKTNKEGLDRMKSGTSRWNHCRREVGNVGNEWSVESEERELARHHQNGYYMSIKQWKEAALDRIAWKMIVHKVTESRIRLNGSSSVDIWSQFYHISIAFIKTTQKKINDLLGSIASILQIVAKKHTLN